jgi:transcription initiation factor TFIID subunit 13
MYGFGDVQQPDQDSIDFMESLIMDYINDLVSNYSIHPKCQEAKKVSKTNSVKTVHFMHVLRKDAKKYARAKELLALDKELKQARATFDLGDI